MYDSIKLYLNQDSARDIDLLAEVPVYLENITVHEKVNEVYYSGSLKNLRVNVSQRGISIRGSLAKYFLSDNMQTLRRQDTEQAIEKLSDELHIPIQDAKVTRIDFAHNFVMKYEPKTYYSYLGQAKRLERLIQPESLYYKNKSKEMVFYNKIAEVKSRRAKIPEIWEGKNLLRYEIRYMRNLSGQLKVPEVKACSLYEEKFYIHLVDRYVDDYVSIHKHGEIILDTDNMKKPKDVLNQLALQSLNSLTQGGKVDFVEELRNKNIFENPEYYSRLKKNIRLMRKKYEASDSLPLIEELDSKILVLKKYYR